MQNSLCLKPILKKFIMSAVIGGFGLMLLPKDVSAHGRGCCSSPSRPVVKSPSRSSNTRPPVRHVRPVSMQQLQQRLHDRGIQLSASQLEGLKGLDERVLGVMDGLFGNFNSYTQEQKNIAMEWLANTIDSSGQIQGALDDAEFYNRNAWIADNIGFAVSIGKGGVLVFAAVTNPAVVPVLIAIEGTATNVEHGATAVGEITASLQDGWSEENVIRGLENGAIAVSIRVAGGKAGGKMVNFIFPPGALGHNLKTKVAMQAAVITWSATEGAKTAIGKAISSARDHYNSRESQSTTTNFTLPQNLASSHENVPVQSTTTNFTLPQNQASSHENIPVQTTVADFTLSPEQLEQMQQRRGGGTTQVQPSSASQTDSRNDEVGQFLQGHLSEQANQDMTNSIQGYLDTGTFNPPTQPGPTPQAVKGNSTTTSETFDNLFINHLPQVRGARP